ncbi:MAG: exonuclease domain-containing protein [Actinomycetota bacterium]
MEFASLDFETTGLDLATDSVVSWGVVPVTAGGVDLRGADYRLVAPERPISEESVRIHELRPVDLGAAPALREVSGVLGDALSGRFLLAWAATIEIAFLHRILGGAERRWRRRTIDVRDLAFVRLRREGEPVSGRGLDLEAACRRLGVPVERTHHAFDDALMTAELFLVLAGGWVSPRGRMPTVRDLMNDTRSRPRPSADE